MISQDVTIPVDGSNMQAYLARPEEGSGAHPAVIVLQEAFGFTPETKRVTELLASIGYVGLAINYYHRTNPQMIQPYTEEGVKKASEIAASVMPDNLNADVRGAIDWLNSQPFVKHGKIATWGFDFGANAAFVTADQKDLSGAMLFYPPNLTQPLPSGGEPPIEHAAQVHCPLLIIYGEQDYYVPRYEMDLVNKTLKAAGKEVQMQIYPGVGHAFFRHGQPQAIMELQRYSDEAVAQAVADAWGLVKAFLLDVFNRPRGRAAETGDIRRERTQSARA